MLTVIVVYVVCALIAATIHFFCMGRRIVDILSAEYAAMCMINLLMWWAWVLVAAGLVFQIVTYEVTRLYIKRRMHGHSTKTV